VSLGAGILANYMGIEKESCVLEAGVAVNCHFDTKKASDYLRSNFYGLYDYVLGINCRLSCRSMMLQYDKLVSKKNPEKQVMKDFDRVLSFSKDFSEVVMKAGGYARL